MKKLLFVSCIVALVVPTYANAQQPEKRRITSIDDLPRHTYEVIGTVTDLVTSEEAFRPFAARVRADVEEDLAAYEIEDKTTLRGIYGTILVLDMLEGNYDEALKTTEVIRELQDKPASRLMTGLVTSSIIRAHRESGEEDENARKQAFSHYLSESIRRLPWEVVQERIEAQKGQMEMSSKNVLLGVIQSQLEPVVEQTGQVSSEIAAQIIGMRFTIEMLLPLKDEVVAVYEKYIAANRVEKVDVWKERDVDLTVAKEIHPVVIAIWDTGVDTDVFPDKLFTNKGETLNGKDDDDNGYIDDIHGIAYTLDNEKTPELLYPIVNAEERLPEMKDMLKGLFDLIAAIDSPDAIALKEKMATLRPEEVKPLMEDLMQFGLHLHGTHVAGIAIAGNPVARILVARLTADYRTIPCAPTVDNAHKTAQMYQEVVEYFKKQGVRVVNMSWSGTLRETESALEKNGIGKDAQERAKLAREIFDIEKKALYDAIQRAPEILFVNAAGNENDDVSFEDYYPAAFDLPNILVVGAVDQAGDETSFTSFGERVDVYANGFEVESFLPGGDRMSASGTSMSSPNGANLAAKLVTLEPSLTPVEVISVIKEGADWSPDGRLLLINPKRSVEMLKSFKRN